MPDVASSLTEGGPARHESLRCALGRNPAGPVPLRPDLQDPVSTLKDTDYGNSSFRQEHRSWSYVLRGQAETRLNDAVEIRRGRIFRHVTVMKDGSGFKTECAVHFDHGPVMHVTGEATDAYQSLGIAIERIAKQLRRFKRKRDRHAGERPNGVDLSRPCAISPTMPMTTMMSSRPRAAARQSSRRPSPMHRSTRRPRPLPPSRRTMRRFSVFRNIGTQRVNVLYRRKDGHYGWVDIG